MEKREWLVAVHRVNIILGVHTTSLQGRAGKNKKSRTILGERFGDQVIMGKRKKPLTFAERLEKAMAKHDKRQEESLALYRREQARQGLKPDQPISLIEMMKGMEKRKEKKKK